MKIARFIHRLSQSSPKELNFRLSLKMIELFEKTESIWKRIPVPKKKSTVMPGNFLFYYPANRPNIPINYSSIENIFSSLCFFDFQPGMYDKMPNWHKNPKTNYCWPLKFYKRLSLSPSTKRGDVKYVWEPNRFQHFFSYASRYLETRNLIYSETVTKQISNWINTNPYLYGINWTSALEVSLRVISWLFVRDIFGDTIYWTASFDASFQNSLFAHGKYLSRHLSYYSSPYNHLIGEATGLFLLGSFFENDPQAKKWQKRGLSILEEEILKQFHPDGVSVEQSTSYQRFVIEFYILTLLRLERKNAKIPPNILKMLDKAFDFLLWFTPPNREIPMVGDNDNGRVLGPDHNYYWDFSQLFTLGAVLLKRGDLKALSSRFNEDYEIILGPMGRKKFDLLPKQSLIGGIKKFPDGGYYVSRSGWSGYDDMLWVDIGPIAHGVRRDDIPSAAHGHADILSFEFYLKGKPLFQDSGMHSYNGSLDDHLYFRSTQAHNTVVVDGVNQVFEKGRMKWCLGTEGHCDSFLSTENCTFVQGHFDGFFCTGDSVRHLRSIFFFHEKLLVILDKLEGTFPHTYTINFHLGDTFLPKRNGKYISLNDKAVIMSLLPEDVFFSIIKGRRATGYGYSQETSTLSKTIENAQKAHFVTVVFFQEPSRKNLNSIIMVEATNIWKFDFSNSSTNVPVVKKNSQLSTFDTDFSFCLLEEWGEEGNFVFLGIQGTFFKHGKHFNVRTQSNQDIIEVIIKGGRTIRSTPSNSILELIVNGKCMPLNTQQNFT